MPKLFGLATLVIIATLTLVVDKTMSKPRCDMLKIAEEHIAKHFPFFYPTSLKQVVSENGNLWELTYELPVGVLGGVPIVTIDKRTCKVVCAEHSQ